MKGVFMFSFGKRTASTLVVAAAIVGSVIVASPANAAPTAGGSASGDQCWTEVDTGRSLCAPTADALAEQMYARYGVTLGARPGETLQASIAAPTQRMLAKRGVAAAEASKARATATEPLATAKSTTYLLAKIFDGQKFTGGSKLFTVSLQSQPCNSVQNYAYGQEERLWVYGWNDRVRSFQVATKCRLALYSNERFTGTKWGPKHDTGSLGIMDKQASSFSIQA